MAAKVKSGKSGNPNLWVKVINVEKKEKVKQWAKEMAQKRAINSKKRLLEGVEEEHSFILADGRKLKKLSELAAVLENMPENVLRHHVNEGRNDFSCWIRDTMGYNELAEQVAKLSNPAEIQN